MKTSIKYFYLVALATIINCVLTANTFAQGKPGIEFDTLAHHFGEVNVGDSAITIFEFTNTGTAPLKINEIKTTCSCTASNYSKGEIAPGKRGFVKVSFDTDHKNGPYIKGVNVYSNAGERNILIYITVNGDKNLKR